MMYYILFLSFLFHFTTLTYNGYSDEWPGVLVVNPRNNKAINDIIIPTNTPLAKLSFFIFPPPFQILHVLYSYYRFQIYTHHQNGIYHHDVMYNTNLSNHPYYLLPKTYSIAPIIKKHPITTKARNPAVIINKISNMFFNVFMK